jgi:acetyl esterase/lipase
MAGAFKAAPDCAVEKISAHGVPALWIEPKCAHNDSAIMYLHGGGYMIGSAQGYVGIASAIGKASGMRVLVVDYRLAPEHPYPAAVEDALTAYKWLLERDGLRASVLVGDSAGGGLSMATLAELRKRCATLPAGVSLISPWIDLKIEGGSILTKAAVDPVLTQDGLVAMAGAFLGNEPIPDCMTPLHADLSGYPPLQIQVGSHEILLDDSLRLAARSASANVSTTLRVWPGMIHDWPLHAPFLSDGRAAISQIAEFVRACCGHG